MLAIGQLGQIGWLNLVGRSRGVVAPRIRLSNLNITEGNDIDDVIGTADINGTVTGTPAWSISGADADKVEIDAVTGVYTALVVFDREDQATLNVTFSVADVTPAVADKNATISIDNLNEAPTVANPIADQVAAENEDFSLQFATNVFADVDGDPLTYDAFLSPTDPLPAWLSFDPGTRTFSGTPTPGDSGTYTIRVVATDGGAMSVYDEFSIVVSEAMVAPAITLMDSSDSGWSASDKKTNVNPPSFLIDTLTGPNLTEGETLRLYGNLVLLATKVVTALEALTLEVAFGVDPLDDNTYSFTITRELDAALSPHSEEEVVTIDTADPEFSSIADIEAVDDTVLDHDLIYNELCTATITGGDDAAEFEIVGGASFATTHVLRWLSDGTKDYEAPDDDDADGEYLVQIQIIDEAGNMQTQDMTVTLVAEAYVPFGTAVQRRMSAMNLHMPWRHPLVIPDGTIDQADRQQLATLYGGREL
jgi:hypothetical protein